jgi:stage III sporulation protein SpoIIIAA
VISKQKQSLNDPFGGQSAKEHLQLLLDVLPKRVQTALSQLDLHELIEIVLDLGRVPEARFSDGTIKDLGEALVTLEEINHVVNLVGDFSTDNRAGIPRTLHRISAIRNRKGDVVGLTCRVGKVVIGTIEAIRDLVESGKSILMMGRPGVGKTTKLREVAKLIADQLQKRVVIVDTSNEIAGDGDIPHPAVGRARRMQVATHDQQKEVMIEAVQNHTPEVIVVDEIGTEEEALAARTIAERGVILIATAHGSTLESLIKNPVLSDLVGGIQTVTLGDDEAKRRATQKTILEREKKPTFDIAIEIRDRNTLAIYPDVAEAVDHILRGWSLFPEVRKIDYQTGELKVLQTDIKTLPGLEQPEEGGVPAVTPFSLTDRGSDRDIAPINVGTEEFRIFLYGVSKAFVDRILDRLNMHNIKITKHVHDAHGVLALRSGARPGSKILQLAQDYEVPVYFVKANTMPQIQRTLREALSADPAAFSGKLADEPFQDETELALQETQESINKVLTEDRPIELTPRRSYIRRLQHELVEKHNLLSFSVGDEPNRRLKILPPAKEMEQDAG